MGEIDVSVRALLSLTPAISSAFGLRQAKTPGGVLRDTALPTVNGCVFCKRWHLAMSCFTGCPRAASHVHPPPAVVNTVASALTASRAAAVAAV